jgi:cytochrome c-type biogenesis protein CcmH
VNLAAVMKLATSLLASTLLVASAGRAATKKASVESVGDQVMCLCGCVATMNHCPHIDCSTREEMRATIQKEIAKGKDETAILQALAIRYGVQVLAAPPTGGFNLTVWVLPGVGMLVGLVLVVIVVRRLRSHAATQAEVPTRESDPRLLAAVEDEMKASGLGH